MHRTLPGYAPTLHESGRSPSPECRPSTLPPFRVLSLPRLFRLTVLFRRFDVFTNADASRVAKFIIIFLFFAHAMGCVWWLTGYAAQFWRNSGAILRKLF